MQEASVCISGRLLFLLLHISCTLETYCYWEVVLFLLEGSCLFVMDIPLLLNRTVDSELRDSIFDNDLPEYLSRLHRVLGNPM